MPTLIANPPIVTSGGFALEDILLRGGFRCVSTMAQRDAIPLTYRKIGMTVAVQENNSEYRLEGAISNASWRPKTGITSSIIAVTSLTCL